MKVQITEKQFNDLPDFAKKSYLEWARRHGYYKETSRNLDETLTGTIVGNMKFMDVTDMLAFLKEMHQKVDLTSADETSLCDLLWERVRYVLEHPSES